jgi:hypothetical protein
MIAPRTETSDKTEKGTERMIKQAELRGRDEKSK